jgi:hypothetical protein
MRTVKFVGIDIKPNYLDKPNNREIFIALLKTLSHKRVNMHFP